MFDRIAHSYDLLNHLLSLGIDRRWRRAAIASLRPYAPKSVLDVATGTGDFALLGARMLRPERLVGVDLSEGMLAVGREKVKRAGLDGVITFRKDDCLHLSMDADTFDAVTVAYGIRNFEDLDQGLREMCRVLRPGGRLAIIELCTPVRFPHEAAVPPLLAGADARRGASRLARRPAYRYLPATMEAFPQGEVMQGILERAGFREVRFRRFTFGLSTLYNPPPSNSPNPHPLRP